MNVGYINRVRILGSKRPSWVFHVSRRYQPRTSEATRHTRTHTHVIPYLQTRSCKASSSANYVHLVVLSSDDTSKADRGNTENSTLIRQFITFTKTVITTKSIQPHSSSDSYAGGNCSFSES